MSRFSMEKVEQFNDELGELVQRYLDMTDVDAMSLAAPLERRAREVCFIGAEERRRFKEKSKGGLA